MADIYRPSLRLRPSEQRTVLLIGDFIASAAATAGAVYFWYQYSLYRLVESGVKPNVAERILQIEVPFWFFLLPLVWLLLMVDSYEIHTASNWRKTLRGIAVAPINSPLQPKESITLSMDFTVTVPQSVELNYGVQAYFDDVLTLAHAYPMIAVYDDEGWNAEIPPQSGDVTYADMSFFLVTVDAPKDLVLVSVGREILRHAERNGNRQTVQYAAGPVRDYYLAASPNYEVVTKEANGVTIRFYAPADQKSGAERTFEIAAKSIEVFENRYAAYPYTELDFVSTPTLALGIEYPGTIAIADRIVSPYHEYLEGTVAHEVGHQWFYNLVVNDQLDDPWLDESLTQFATLQYFSDQYGKKSKKRKEYKQLLIKSNNLMK